MHSERWASTLFLSFLVEMASVFVPDLSLGHFLGPSPNLQQDTQSCPPAAWPVWLPGLSGCPASGSSWCEALGMEPVPPPFAAPPFSQSLPCLERARPASFRSFLDSSPPLQAPFWCHLSVSYVVKRRVGRKYSQSSDGLEHQGHLGKSQR